MESSLKCDKCVKSANIVINKVKLCNQCFFDQVLHKIKTVYRTRTRIWKNDKILFCHDCTLLSFSLLQLTSLFLKLDSIKHLNISVDVLFIEHDTNYGKELIEFIKSQYGLNCNVVQLHSLFGVDVGKWKEMCLSEDLVKVIINRVIYNHGKDYRKIIYSLDGDGICQRSFKELCNGTGSRIPNKIGYLNKQLDIEIIYPMREFSPKEGQYLCYLNRKLKYVRYNKSGIINRFIASLNV